MTTNHSSSRPSAAKSAQSMPMAKPAGKTKPSGRQVVKTSGTRKPVRVIKHVRVGHFVVSKNLTCIEIEGNRQLKTLSTPSQQAVLKTVAGVGDSIVQHVDSDSEVEYLSIVQAVTKNITDVLFTALKTDDPSRKRVDAQRVEPVELAARSVIGRLIQDAYSTEITDVQLSDRAQLAIDAFNVVLSGDRLQLESVIAALDTDEMNDGDDKIELARARARIRMQAIFRKIISESFTVSQLKPYKSRQRLQQLRDENRLFAIKTPYERGLVYPSWQFDDAFDPLAAMPELIQVAKEADLSPLGFHQIMTGRRTGGETGVKLLGEGREDLALSLLRASNRAPSRPRR